MNLITIGEFVQQVVIVNAEAMPPQLVAVDMTLALK